MFSKINMVESTHHQLTILPEMSLEQATLNMFTIVTI